MCLQTGNKVTQTKHLKLYCLDRQNKLILIDVSPCHSQDLQAIYRKKKKHMPTTTKTEKLKHIRNFFLVKFISLSMSNSKVNRQLRPRVESYIIIQLREMLTRQSQPISLKHHRMRDCQVRDDEDLTVMRPQPRVLGEKKNLFVLVESTAENKELNFIYYIIFNFLWLN